MPAVLHFNSHVHRKNKTDGGERKALVCRRTKTAKAVKCDEIRLQNVTGRLVYRPWAPLKCGAVAWIEIDDGTVLVVNPEPHDDCPVTEGAGDATQRSDLGPPPGDETLHPRAVHLRAAKRQRDAPQGPAGAG